MKNRGTKRLFAAFLTLVLLLALCPVIPQVEAASATDNCPCCGKAYSSISWSSSGYTNRDLSKPGHYKLIKAFTLSKECEVTGKVTVDLNGFLLRAAPNNRGFVVKDGGVLTIINRGGDNGRISHETGAVVNKDGGTIYVEEGGTLNIISGRVVGTTMSHNGGAIYNAGTMNMYGGSIESGDVTGNGGNIYNSGTLNIYDGVVKKGVAKSGGYGGNIANVGTMYMEGGLITGGTSSGDNGYGGNVYNGATFTMKDGTLENGVSQDHAGNLFVGNGTTFHMYGGLITGGKATGYGSSFSGYGGNIYTTGAETDIKIYGGTITAGQDTYNTSYGGNISANGGVQIYMYGGTLSYGAATNGSNLYLTGNATVGDAKQYSAFYLLGGTIISSQDRDLHKGAAANIIKMYNGRYTGSVDISGFVQACCCCVTTDNSHVIWNPGYEDRTCTDCLYAQAAQAGLVEESGGSHNFSLTGENTYTCSGCGTERVLENVVALVNGEPFEDLEAAVFATATDEKLILLADATISEAAMMGTLDLNGKTLTVTDAFTSAGGNVIDTSNDNSGKLICPDATLSETNAYLPVNYDGALRFCPVDFKQWVEPVDADTTKVKFYITQRSYQTIMDDAIKSGNTEIQVQIHLTWTSSNGNPNDGYYTFSGDLLQKYAEKWNGRVFVTTISGVNGVKDLTCSYQVTSTAATGATRAATTISTPGYINDKLSWEKIESFPIKTQDMTVEQMRDLCVDFMYFTKTYLWTPSVSVDFIKNASGTKDSMSQGTVYGGLPYVGVASGNPYRMMDYIDPATGILDMQKALPMLGTKDRLTMADLRYFGTQCSESVYWGWGRVMNSAKYMWTSSVVPKNGFVLLGDIEMDETRNNWSATYNTDLVCMENGERVMFAAYAQAKKADGMVYYIEASDGDGAGHLVMIYKDAYVAYNDDGTINGDESYLSIIDQGQKWEEATNDQGDTFQYKSSIDNQVSFTTLYESGYIPFTFKEFLGTDPIEETEVSLVNGTETLISGEIRESDRSFQAAATTDALTWSQIFSANVTSNYGIVDAYLIVKDNKGNELYKHAVRTVTAGNKNMPLAESGAMVTTWVTQNLTAGKTYSAELVVQLATGERPTIWSGELEYNK